MLKLYIIFSNRRMKHTTFLNKNIQFLLIECFFILIIIYLRKRLSIK